jgi:hypothetical protein
MKPYQTINGTFYDVRTPAEVIRVLESARQSQIRLHVSLGDVETGRDWLEEFDSHGYVGRSMGPIKVPLLIANSRSLGGGAMLDHCIVRIRSSSGGRVLYQHPNYNHSNLQIRQKAEPVELPDGRVLTVDVLRDGEVHASFEGMAQARQWAKKLGVTAPIAA